MSVGGTVDVGKEVVEVVVEVVLEKVRVVVEGRKVEEGSVEGII